METKIKPVHTARCHCGAVELALKLPNGLVDLRRCNCSMCRRRAPWSRASRSPTSRS
ncbi:hypothetical protein FHS62_001776 [Amphiplicatus metriothermophilus]|nr:hypothetical protein [Amphiplicatus metriothermophilus]MBB5518959.1 hypothetical protein [Amphiplicatus metriothermophilus]